MSDEKKQIEEIAKENAGEMADERTEIVEEKIVEEETGPQMSNIHKLWGIIVEPVKTLEAIRRKPNIWLPIGVAMIMMAIFSLVTWPTVEQSVIMEMERKLAETGAEMPENMMNLTLTITRVSMLLGAPIMLILMLLIRSLYYFIAGKVVKRTLGYKQTMSMLAHIGMVSMISIIVVAVVTLITGEFAQSIGLTSLVSFLPESTKNSFLGGVAQTFDIFVLWGFYLTYIGLRIVGYFSKKAAMITVGISWLALALVTGGSVMLQSMANSLG